MFAEPDDGFKPAWHDAAAQRGRPQEDGPEPACGICNARPGQPHLATGRYP